MRVRIWPCRDCGRNMVPATAHRKMRAALRMRFVRHLARGLCSGCYWRHKTDGSLLDFEARKLSRDELLTEWELLRSDGVRLDVAAERIGTSAQALDRALHRALSDGDQRGRHTGCYFAKDKYLRRAA